MVFTLSKNPVFDEFRDLGLDSSPKKVKFPGNLENFVWEVKNFETSRSGW